MTPGTFTSGYTRRRGRSRTGESNWQLPLPPPFAAPEPAPEPLTVFTIGHSSVPADEFVALLGSHQVETVLDVRSSPYSRYVPHFNREPLRALLAAHAIGYAWAGDTLGGRPDDATCYHGGAGEGGKLDYAAVRQRPWYQRGLHHLLGTALGQPTVLLCSEEDPRRCHRHHLVAHSLLEQGVRVLHIRRSGELEDAETLDQDGPDRGPRQLLLGEIAA